MKFEGKRCLSNVVFDLGIHGDWKRDSSTPSMLFKIGDIESVESG